MGWLSSMTLRAKLILLTSVMMIALIIVGAIGFRSLSTVSDSVDEIATNNIPSLIGIYTARIGVNQVAIQQNRVRGLTSDPKYYEKAANAMEIMKKGFETLEKGIKIYEPLPRSAEEEKLWQETISSINKWRDMSTAFMDTTLKPLLTETDRTKADVYFTQMGQFIESSRVPRNEALKNLGELGDLLDKYAKENGDNAIETSSSSIKLVMLIIVISIIVATILAFIIITSTNRQISTAVQTIHDGSLQISDAADQVASSSTSLAQGASEQASSVEEVSATLEQASAAVVSNTENARQADILAKAANQAAKEGMIKGDDLVESMKEVNDSAAKIAGIVKTIDQIAFQVNLLALNAAVEAARAGEHGLGFAVVADEVRNLAQRAASSAKETGTVIEEAVAQIKKGSQIANDASLSFREIDDKAKKVSNLIGEVAMSSKEQAEAIAQLNSAMAQIDQVTQQVAANSEEAAASSEELSAQSQASLEAVMSLGKVVGLDFGAAHLGKPMSKPKQRAGIANMSKPKSVAAAPKKIASSTQSRSRPDDIFPLDEGDLKEF